MAHSHDRWGDCLKVRILRVFPFKSETGRMTIVLQLPPTKEGEAGKVMVLTKGSESSVKKCLSPEIATSQAVVMGMQVTRHLLLQYTQPCQASPTSSKMIYPRGRPCLIDFGDKPVYASRHVPQTCIGTCVCFADQVKDDLLCDDPV